jgi:hypothetical protein
MAVRFALDRSIRQRAAGSLNDAVHGSASTHSACDHTAVYSAQDEYARCAAGAKAPGGAPQLYSRRATVRTEVRSVFLLSDEPPARCAAACTPARRRQRHSFFAGDRHSSGRLASGSATSSIT